MIRILNSESKQILFSVMARKAKKMNQSPFEDNGNASKNPPTLHQISSAVMSAAKESRRMASTQLPRKRNTWSSLFLSFFSKQTTLFENLTSELSVSELKMVES